VNVQSLLDMPESKLIELLHDDPMFRRWILPFDYPDHWSLFGVPLSELTESDQPAQGDVDLVMLPVDRIEEAVAIQFKRIKVSASTFQTGLANKLNQIRKLAQQANLTEALGFHQVCASILVLVDGRASGFPDPWLSQTPVHVVQSVDREFGRAGFHSGVRVEVLEICQPCDVDFRFRGSTSRRVLQHGRSRVQASQLTSALERRLEMMHF
jgi:hypothetical protein